MLLAALRSKRNIGKWWQGIHMGSKAVSCIWALQNQLRTEGRILPNTQLPIDPALYHHPRSWSAASLAGATRSMYLGSIAGGVHQRRGFQGTCLSHCCCQRSD